MIKVSEIAEKYKDYEIDEKELEKLLVKPKAKSVWDLKDGDKYWCVYRDGKVDVFSWVDCLIDKKIRDCGNIFLTKEEAEFEVERRKCEAIMLKYGTRDMMSLGNGSRAKYCIMHNYSDCVINCDYYGAINYQGIIWFASREIAQQCIDEIGEDRLKKYIFNVKE